MTVGVETRYYAWLADGNPVGLISVDWTTPPGDTRGYPDNIRTLSPVTGTWLDTPHVVKDFLPGGGPGGYRDDSKADPVIEVDDDYVTAFTRDVAA